MKTTPKKGKPDLVQVSAFVTREMRDDLSNFGNGNVSEGLRRLVAAPSHAPSGALWLDHPLQLPDPARCTGPQVWAMEPGLLVYGIGPTNLSIDCEESQISFQAPGGSAAAELTFDDLADLSGRLGGAVLACCGPANVGPITQAAGPIRVSRLAPGLVELAPTGQSCADCAVALPLRQALQFAAEVAGLLARRFKARQLAITELNNNLAQPVEAG